jgi:hypothetical protein
LEVYKENFSSKWDELSGKEITPPVRLREVLEFEFPNVPKVISMRLEDRTREIDIFNYVLRHTFWRPRDILYYWGRILATAEYYLEKGLTFDDTSVKIIISNIQST